MITRGSDERSDVSTSSLSERLETRVVPVALICARGGAPLDGVLPASHCFTSFVRLTSGKGKKGGDLFG